MTEEMIKRLQEIANDTIGMNISNSELKQICQAALDAEMARRELAWILEGLQK